MWENVERNSPLARKFAVILVPSKSMLGAASGTASGRDVIMLPTLKGPYDKTYVADRTSSSRQKFVHEFVHTMDKKRYKADTVLKAKDAADRGDMGNYYRSPEEFNAFFQDGAHAIELAVKSLASFDPGLRPRIIKNMVGRNKREFIAKATRGSALGKWNDEFVKSIMGSKKWKRKFLKRLSGLYDYLKDKYDPEFDEGEVGPPQGSLLAR